MFYSSHISIQLRPGLLLLLIIFIIAVFDVVFVLVLSCPLPSVQVLHKSWKTKDNQADF